MNVDKWYRRPWGIVLLLVLVFPVGLFLMWRHTSWSPAVKWTATGFIGLVLIFDLALIAQTYQEAAGPGKVEPSDKPKVFDESMVRNVFVSKKHLGGQAEVSFVNSAMGADLLASAKRCVAEFTEKQKAAYCFAYASEEDYEYAQVNTVAGGAKKTCWIARAGQAISGATTEGQDNSIYKEEGCPGAR